VRVAQVLTEQGIAALTVHGRTRAQGYSGSADWDVIAEVAATASVPVIGNGDLVTPMDIVRRRAQTKISGVMIGRAAMSSPWIFHQAKHYLATGQMPAPPTPAEKWKLILRHCRLTAELWGEEEPAIRSMRARLMAYSKGFPNGKLLREKFQHVSLVHEIEAIAHEHLQTIEAGDELAVAAAEHNLCSS
jgi:tRNA-dihydrouridine synthase B